MDGRQHDDGPRTRAELHEALEQVLLAARENDVEVTGGWEARGVDGRPVLDIHVTRVEGETTGR